MAANPPEWAERYGRAGFFALGVFGAAAVGFAGGGIVGYPIIGMLLCAAFPLWLTWTEWQERRR